MASNYNKKACGARIKALRLKRNMTQAELAAALHTTLSNIGKIESGIQGFSVDLLLEMRDFFMVPADYILCGGPVLPDRLAKKFRALQQAVSSFGEEFDSFIADE